MKKKLLWIAITIISIAIIVYFLVYKDRIVEKTQLSADILKVTDYVKINNDDYINNVYIPDTDWLLIFNNGEHYRETKDSHPELGDRYCKEITRFDVYTDKNNYKKLIKTYKKVKFEKINDEKITNIKIPKSL